MVSKVTEHLILGPCHQLGCSQKDPSSHLKVCRADLGRETETNNGGLAISQGLLAYQRRFCGAQCKEKRKGRQKKWWKDNIKGWTGGWTLLSQIGKLKTGPGGKGLL